MFTFIQGVQAAYFDNDGRYQEASKEPIRLAKIFDRRGKSSNPEMVKFFNCETPVNPSSLQQVLKLLEAYKSNPEYALLRGTPINGTRKIRRNTETFNCSLKSRIIHMDIDGIPLPDNIHITDIREQGKFIVSLLANIEPTLFKEDAAFVAKASGSAGIKEGIRIHLYMHSKTPVSNGQMKMLATNLNKKSYEVMNADILDTSVYDRVHLMYTADPIFADPSMNPFKNVSRLVKVEGESLELPENLPEYVHSSRSITLTEEHQGFLAGIEGYQDSTSEHFDKCIERLEQANDNVFTKHAISLYCTAVEQGVDIEWLDAKVLPMLQKYKKRGKGKAGRSPEQYIQQAKNAALQITLGRSIRTVPSQVDVGISGESSTMPVTTQNTDSDPKDRFLHINKLPPEDSLTFVKASLGTGKTTTVQTWLSSGLFEGRFLAITNTVSLVEGNAKKLGAGCYNKLKDYNDFKTGYREGIGEYETRYDRMSTTIHSLHRFKDTVDQRGIDMVFIDECDAVMNDILFSDVVKERDKIISTLALILQSAKYVVLSDGDISSETVEAYARLCDPVKQVVIYRHDRKMLLEATARELPDENSVWAAMQGALDIGDKCLLVSDCSPKELNEKGIALRASTACNIKEVHKNSTKDADIKEILTFGNSALQQQKVDGLLCSPSVTSGVDFNYFDTVFLLTRDSGIHTPNLRFQALRRDRGAKSIYYYTSPQTQGFDAGSSSYMENLGWSQRCRKIYARRRERECEKYQSTLRILLRDQGCHIIIDGEKWGKLESAGAEYREQRIDAILAATPTFQLQRHADAWEVKQLIVRYYDEVEDLGSVDSEIVRKWLKEKPHDRATFFHKIYRGGFWPSIKKCLYNWDCFVQEIRKNPSAWYQATGLDVRTEKWRIKSYLRRSGIKEPGQFDSIIKWYRTWCKLEGIQIPVEFLTEDEKEMYLENNVEM